MSFQSLIVVMALKDSAWGYMDASIVEWVKTAAVQVEASLSLRTPSGNEYKAKTLNHLKKTSN